MKNNTPSFYTLKGYQLIDNAKLSYSMEDYLEMICRMSKTHDIVRVSELAYSLHVKPSSVSKMVNNLKDLGLVSFERYGYIKPTSEGISIGNYLLYRHDVLNKLLCLINNSKDETEQVEKIEHFLNEKTINNIKKYLEKNSVKEI